MNRSWLRTSALALVLILFFWGFTAGLSQRGAPSVARSCALLFGAIAVFRLMAGFEKGR
jgi:hypothetical protein